MRADAPVLITMKPAKVYMQVDMHELITGVTDRLELLQLFSDAERKQPEDRLPGALAFHGTWQMNCCNVATHMAAGARKNRL